MRKVLAYVPDLIDRSKVAGAARSGQVEVSFVSRPADLAGAAAAGTVDLVVVDLNRPGVLEALKGVAAPVVAFSRHTDREAMDAAVAAGTGQVLARSAFFTRLDELIGGDPAPSA